MARTKTTSAPTPKSGRTLQQLLREPTTWAGILTVGATIATGGVSVLTDPLMLSKIGAGLALVLAKEGS